MSIQKLSSAVRSQIESGLTITDATQCTLELVENSLDAKASAIAVRVKLSEFTIEVVDNGTGISSQDLKLIGKRYMTSKCHDFDDLNKTSMTYGYRGQALASIAEISGKLTIKSKCKTSKETLVKMFRNGEPPSFFVSKKERSDKGTTVTVHDFMCTMPVRRKRISEVFDLQDIKNQMEYLAIIHNEVCFTLRDESKGEILLQTHKKTNPGLSLRDMFGLASDKFFVPLNYKEKNIAVEGYISLRRHFESNLKFFYVNNRIVFKSMVHKLVDLCIDKYFKEKADIPEEVPDFEGININFPKNNHNVYIVKIFCPYTYFVMFRNLRRTTVEFKDWDVILTCIKRAIKTTLHCKPSPSEPEKIEKIAAADPTKLACRNVQAVRNLKNGIKGGLVKRKFDCGDFKQGRINEESKYFTEGVGIGQDNFSGFKKLSKLEFVNSSESHTCRYEEGPKVLSQGSTKQQENYLKAKDLPVLTNLTNSVSTENVKSMKCTDFLDFLAWFRCKLKEDSEIYNDFVKYKRNFKKLKRNTCSDEVKKKLLRYKSLARKTKYMEVHKEKEERKKKREISNSAFLRGSSISRKIVRKHSNDKIEVLEKIPKSNNCAQPSPELTSKKLREESKLGNNSSEDLAESQKKPSHALLSCWYSHQNRVNLVSQVDDPDKENSKHLKLNIDESKKKQTFCRRKTKVKRKVKSQNYAEKGSEINPKRKNIEYKDFGVQTDKDFVTTPSNCRPIIIHSCTPNIKTPKHQVAEDNEQDNELSKPTSMDLIGKQACHKAEVFSSPAIISTLQLNNLKTAAQGLILFNCANKITETISKNDSDMFNERLSNELSRGTASEKLINIPKMTTAMNSNFRNHSKLVHSDPVHSSSNINSRNKTVTPGRWPTHSTFTFTERYNFLPKGLSQSALDRTPVNDFKTERDNNDLVKRSDPCANNLNASKGSGLSRSLLPSIIFEELQRKTDENMIYYEKPLLSANLLKNKAEMLSLGTFTIDKEELSNITVVGQWDKKFILAVVDVMSSKKKKFLAIFDQHAVDERIILEKLLKEFRTPDGHFVSVCYDPPIKCTVKESVGRLLLSFEKKLLNYGIKTSIVDNENVLLHEIPLCFADKSILEKGESFFQSLLNNIVGELSETRGIVPAIPKAYYDVISTRACRSAVKFNDVLSHSAMKKMMNDLVACQIPFQCAHGRPCIVPILDIEHYKIQVQKEQPKLNFKKFRTESVYQTQ